MKRHFINNNFIRERPNYKAAYNKKIDYKKIAKKLEKLLQKNKIYDITKGIL